LPSDALLDRICAALGADKKEMAQRIAKDRMIFKYGDAAWEYLGINPRLGPICVLLSSMQRPQKDNLIRMWKAMVAANRAKAKKTRETKKLTTA